jgi:2-keto-myo-inositol isomerase
MPLALHTWTLDTTPLGEILSIVRETGWDAIELRRVDFARAAQAGRSANLVLDEVAASGLAVACVGVEFGWMWADGEERKRLLRVFAESCAWAKRLGCATVMSPADKGTGDVARAAASIREVGDIAAAHGVRVAIEFNSQAEQWNRLEPMREVVTKAGHPACGVLLDTYHIGRSGCDMRALEDVRLEEIAYVQYSDVPRKGLVPGQALDRLPPGQGSVPFREIFDLIARKGYRGYMSYEAPNPAAWKRPGADVAREALAATRAVFPR